MSAYCRRRRPAPVQHLGRRHAQYGVEDEHYGTVGTVLLSTLRAGLGDALNREAEEAWAVASSRVLTKA